jgi:hypothetical protein
VHRYYFLYTSLKQTEINKKSDMKLNIYELILLPTVVNHIGEVFHGSIFFIMFNTDISLSYTQLFFYTLVFAVTSVKISYEIGCCTLKG